MFCCRADPKGQCFRAVLERELSKISIFFQSQEAAVEVSILLGQAAYIPFTYVSTDAPCMPSSSERSAVTKDPGFKSSLALLIQCAAGCTNR